MQLLQAPPRKGAANSRISFIHPKDAGGVLIELVEPAGVDSGSTKDHSLVRPRVARFAQGDDCQSYAIIGIADIDRYRHHVRGSHADLVVAPRASIKAFTARDAVETTPRSRSRRAR